MHLQFLFSLLPVVVLCSPQYHSAPSRHGLPFSTSGRDILTTHGEKFLYAGTNWPGHQEAMIPEGLQYSSVHDIVAKIKGLGLNSVRLTFAIEMVDQIYEKGRDTGLEETLITALGTENGTRVLAQVLGFNKAFTKDTTRLEVFDAVAKEFDRQGIILHLDNHMSKAKWRCGPDDGSGWFGDRDFSVKNWTRGWSYMASHASKNWPTFASVGLRNELRTVPTPTAEPYDWYTWYRHMTRAASAVHASAPGALIFFSGLDYDSKIQPIPLGLPLNGTSNSTDAGKVARFDPDNFPFKRKVVLELHKYDFEHTNDTCADFERKWYELGWQAVDLANPAAKFHFPLVVSEWGFIQDGVYWNTTTYNKCLIEMVRKWKVGWLQWDLAGSYLVRTRNGVSVQDDDETWGLLNHNWTGIRNSTTVENSLEKMIEALE